MLEADFESNLSYEQISGILSAVKLKKRFYRLSNGSFIDLENSKQKDIFNLLDQLDFSFEDIKNGKKVIPKYHALYLNSLSSVEKNEEFKKYIEEIKNIEPVIPVSYTHLDVYKRQIYDYEKDCAVFERFIEENRKQAIKRVYDDFPQIGLEVYSDEIVYVYRECEETKRFLTRSYEVVYS